MEVERIILFESARDKAAEQYLRSPLDADNLIRWGGVLLELSHFYKGQASVNMLQDAVSKFEEALKINPKEHYALWCLGNAFTAQNFLLFDTGKVNVNFRKAVECYQKALDEDPHNEHYLKALEMAKKAPSLHKEILKQLTSEEVVVNEEMNIEGSSSQRSVGTLALGLQVHGLWARADLVWAPNFFIRLQGKRKTVISSMICLVGLR